MKKTDLRAHILSVLRENAFVLLIRLTVVIAYITLVIFARTHSERLAEAAANMPLLSPVFRWALTHLTASTLVIGGAAVLFCMIYPLERHMTEDAFRAIGMVNRADLPPTLLRRCRDKAHPNVTIWRFRNNGVALHTWEERQAEIETALGVSIVQMRYGGGNQHVLLHTVPAANSLPERIVWKDSYLSSDKASELVLGQGLIGMVTVDLADIPHILLGGATGSGKSVLLKCLILQCVKKGASVAIADFKGGVDYPQSWRTTCRMCFDEAALLALLTSYANTLQERKRLFSAAGTADLDEYNRKTGADLQRFVLAFDEISEVLDTAAMSREQKERHAGIVANLSLIARQGRAFGIHLILATQRPDAGVLPGQIRSNINCRICGRADQVLSQIILDSTAAAELIPKYAKGRFLLHDGTLFQAFLPDDGLNAGR